VVLPSLDRLSGLIERVVELVEAVGDARGAPPPTEPAPVPSPVPEEPPTPASAPPAPAAPAEPAAGWLAFVSTAHGYRLVEQSGPPPGRGDAVELEGGRGLVVKIGTSPLPGDSRRCAYVVVEEPRAEARTSDA
jgi:hypothetical protein